MVDYVPVHVILSFWICTAHPIDTDSVISCVKCPCMARLSLWCVPFINFMLPEINKKDAEQKPATSNINQPDRGTTAHSSKKTSLITTSIVIMLIQYK